MEIYLKYIGEGDDTVSTNSVYLALGFDGGDVIFKGDAPGAPAIDNQLRRLPLDDNWVVNEIRDGLTAVVFEGEE